VSGALGCGRQRASACASRSAACKSSIAVAWSCAAAPRPDPRCCHKRDTPGARRVAAARTSGSQRRSGLRCHDGRPLQDVVEPPQRVHVHGHVRAGSVLELRLESRHDPFAVSPVAFAPCAASTLASKRATTGPSEGGARPRCAAARLQPPAPPAPSGVPRPRRVLRLPCRLASPPPAASRSLACSAAVRASVEPFRDHAAASWSTSSAKRKAASRT
jgi:hypothetical protein